MMIQNASSTNVLIRSLKLELSGGPRQRTVRCSELLDVRSLHWFRRQLRSMPTRHNPNGVSLTTVKKPVRCNNYLTKGKIGKLQE